MNTRTSIPLCLLTASVIAASALAALAADLPEAAPGDEGFAADLGEKVDAVLSRRGRENVHGVVIVHDGKIVLERYLTGNDERMGWLVEGVTFGPDVLHDVRSITKSVIGLLYGIALAEGKVPPLDAPLVDSFPEYADLVTPELRKITIEDALTMRLGFKWREDGPQPTTEIEMLHQADRYRFTLSQPIEVEPGTVFNYNGGGTTLLGRIIARGTGMSIADYGEEKLFGPLGIDDFEWVVDYFGVPYGHGGLRFRPRDLAKLGQLILNDGVWDGRQIVPPDWLAASFKGGMQHRAVRVRLRLPVVALQSRCQRRVPGHRGDGPRRQRAARRAPIRSGPGGHARTVPGRLRLGGGLGDPRGRGDPIVGGPLTPVFPRAPVAAVRSLRRAAIVTDSSSDATLRRVPATCYAGRLLLAAMRTSAASLRHDLMGTRPGPTLF